MDNIKHILLIANSLTNEEAIQVRNTLKDMKEHGITFQISLLYVKPYFPTCYFHIPSMIALAEEFEDEAKETLEYLGEELEISSRDQWIATGRVRPEALKIATTLGVDFVLSSSSIHRDLAQAFSFKRNRTAMPIKTVDNLKAA